MEKKFEYTERLIKWMQNFVKKFLLRKKYWEAIILNRVKDEINGLKGYLNSLRLNVRMGYEHFYTKLLDLEDKGEKYIKIVCRNLAQFIKDIQVLDTYRFNVMMRFAAITKETIDDVRKNVWVRKNEFFKYKPEELQKYPKKIESTINLNK